MTGWSKKHVTPRERQAAKKQQRLDDMAEQVRTGVLRIRQMTDAEREARRVDFDARHRGKKL